MEKHIIEQTRMLNTKKTLKRDFITLGIQKGMTLLVHSSLSSLGWVCGGERAVIEALQEVLTDEGTLIMPAHSGHLSDPAHWSNPPVPEEWWESIREMTPPFDCSLTPTYGIGKIPEAFRTYPNVYRSNHPQTSWSAWGKQAKIITSSHPLDYSLGPQSPLQKMCDLNCNVLFIGTSYDTNTSFHLGEYEQKNLPIQKVFAPILENEQRTWTCFTEIDYDTDPFEEIGRIFESETPVTTGYVGQATCKLFNQREAVRCAKKYYSQY